MIEDGTIQLDDHGRFPELPYNPGDRIRFRYRGDEHTGEISGISVIMPGARIFLGVQLDVVDKPVEITHQDIIRILEHEPA